MWVCRKPLSLGTFAMILSAMKGQPYLCGGCWACCRQGQEVSASIAYRKWLCGRCRAQIDTFKRWKCVKCGEILRAKDLVSAGVSNYMICQECVDTWEANNKNSTSYALRGIPVADHHNHFFCDVPESEKKTEDRPEPPIELVEETLEEMAADSLEVGQTLANRIAEMRSDATEMEFITCLASDKMGEDPRYAELMDAWELRLKEADE